MPRAGFRCAEAASFAAIAIAVFSFSSCTKTTVETKEVVVHDTIPKQVEVHDTVRGPALLRFLSLLPGGRPIIIKYSRDAQTSSFLTAPGSSAPYYLTVRPDTSVLYYLFSTVDKCYDSVPMPALPPNSIYTCALFLDSNASLYWPENDSAKYHPAPPGQCYLRFVNGVSRYPVSQTMLYLDLDTKGSSPFQADSQPQPVRYGTMNDYTLIPAGVHTVIIRSSEDQSDHGIVSQPQDFLPGAYYTVRVTGTFPPDIKLGIDQD